MSHYLRILHKPLSLTGLLLLCLGAAFAQFGEMGYYNQANKLFEQKNYFEAAQCYEKYLASEKKIKPRGQPFAVEKKRKGKTNLNPHEEAVYHLAECYLNTHDFVQAEKWYRKAISFSRAAYPAFQYEYAVSLSANQKYGEAMTAIDSFLHSYSVMDQLLMNADREFENLKYIQSQLNRATKDQFELAPQRTAGGIAAYALTVQNEDTVVFTAIRARPNMEKSGTDEYYNHLSFAVAEDSLRNINGISMPDAGEFHNGLASFSRNGRVMFFTRWTKKDGKTSSAIYCCKRTASGWSEPVKLAAPVNTEGYNSTQPFVTENNYLLFSSDRPGGAGKYDLWYALLDSNLEAYTVGNMGNIVNTPGDDQSPYYHQQSGTLVFASNGRTGMGGFDIYYAKNESDFMHFGQPLNPGIPINSTKDDLYFISTDDDNLWNSGWLSSDRSTDCCLALFSFRENNRQMISGSIADRNSKKPLAGVRLTITDTKHKGGSWQFTTDSLGRYHVEFSNVSRFRIMAERQDYIAVDKRYIIHMNGLSDTVNNGILYMDPVKTEAIQQLTAELKSLSRTNTVGNFAYKKAVLPAGAQANLDSLANLMKHNASLLIRIEGYTDGIGGEAYNRRLATARVNACIAYLISKGIPAARLIGKGMGECCPILPETVNGKDDPAARQINRRVEYKIISDNSEE
jgi:outer membrane protein OmpA-like peptidoglycan-associated protein/tetratricopeptide (TPR) repeat protein